VQHSRQRQGEIAAVAAGETELGAAGRGWDDHVLHLQAVLLAQQHAFTRNGVIEGQAGGAFKPGLNDFGFAQAAAHQDLDPGNDTDARASLLLQPGQGPTPSAAPPTATFLSEGIGLQADCAAARASA